MRLGIVGDLITHAWFENKLTAVPKLGLKFAPKAKKNMPFSAPVIGQVSRRILNHADADGVKLAGMPGGCTGSAGMFAAFNSAPIRYTKRYVFHFHNKIIAQSTARLC